MPPLPRLSHFASCSLIPLLLFCKIGLAQPSPSLNLLWNNEGVSDLSGGLRTGSTYDSMLLASLNDKTGKWGFGNGSLLHLSVLGVQGGQPSTNHIGDFQSVSNIEAPGAARIYSAWFRQRWGLKNSLQLGLIDMNDLFDVTQAAGILLNAAFSLDPTLSGNLPVSTYPEPGYGLVLGRHQGKFNLRLGVFQGNPTQRTDPTFKGVMSIAELDYGYSAQTPLQIGIGLWHYRPPSPYLSLTKRSGGFINVSQALKIGHINLGRLFLELGFCPAMDGTVSQHVGLGINMTGLVPSRPDDNLSLGMTQARFRRLKAETTYEATYQYVLTPTLDIQPDMQFVQNPGGGTGNATVFILRLEWALAEM